MTKPNFCPNCGKQILNENIIAIKHFGDESTSIEANGWDIECVDCQWNGDIFPQDENEENSDNYVQQKAMIFDQGDATSPYESYKVHPLWQVIQEEIEALIENTDIVEQTQRDYIVGSLCKAVLTRGEFTFGGKTEAEP